MAQKLTSRSFALLLAVGMLAAACGSDGSTTDETDGDASVTTVADAPETTAPESTDPQTPEEAAATATTSADDSAGVPSTGAPLTAPPASAGDELSDADYEDAVLDCVYGENEAGSCEALEAAGFTADGNYGLGNSMTQTPDGFLRDDCVGDEDPFSCAELNLRVEDVAQTGAEDARLLCMFYSSVFPAALDAQQAAATPDAEALALDFMHMRTLLGADAPPGVQDGLDRLEVDLADAEPYEAVDGYVGPLCVEFLE